MGAIAGLTIIFGAVYMLRAYGLVSFGETNEQTAQFKDVDTREMLILGTIAILVLVLGFFPGLILNISDASVNQIMSSVPW
ncbi:MAG: hypothetical protein R2778_16280 [Saprospiraceae bacterium]